MMRAEFLTFRTFQDRFSAEDCALILKSKGFIYEIEEQKPLVDPVLTGSVMEQEFRLKLQGKDFTAANTLLEEKSNADLDTADTGHYLLDFSDDELREVVAKPDEWGALNYVLAKKILEKRGIHLQEQELEQLKEERLADLAQPHNVKTVTLVGTYAACLFFAPVVLFIGWHWSHANKTLFNGKRYYVYTKRVRGHGQVLFILGLVLTVIAIIAGLTEMRP